MTWLTDRFNAWLATATVEDIAGALFGLAIGVGFFTAAGIYLLRHRGES